MIKYLLIIALCHLLTVHVSAVKREAQPTWLSADYRQLKYPSSTYFTEFRLIKHVKRSMRNDAEIELDEKLKKALAQNIYSHIVSEEDLWRNELVFMEQTSYSERFVSKVSIESDIELLNSNGLLYYDKKEKELYGFIFIEKQMLAKHYQDLLAKEIYLLESQLESNDSPGQASSTNRQLISAFESKYDKINVLSTVIISCGESLSEKQIRQISGLRNNIDHMYQYLDMHAFEMKLETAQNLLVNKNYEDAYQKYLHLLLIQPDNTRVKAGLSESKMALEAYYLNQIAWNMNRKYYHEAVVHYNGLFALMPFVRQEHLSVFNQLQKEAFDQYAQLLKEAIRSNDLDQMNAQLVILQNYAHINESQFSRLIAQVEEEQAYYLYEQAKFDYYDGRYEQAIVKLKSALALDRGDYTYKGLLNKAQNRIYDQKLHALKMTRPHIFCFQIGAGAQNNFNMLDKYLQTENFSSSIMGVYTAGIYRKFGIKPRVRSNGRDYSKSRIIGFRYTYINSRNASNADAGWANNPVNGLQELEFVFGTATGTNIAVGLVSEDLQFEMLDRNQFYSATLSKRIYFSPIEFSLDLKVYITEDNVYPVLRLSGFVNLNFDRKVHHSDRKKLRYEVENEL